MFLSDENETMHSSDIHVFPPTHHIFDCLWYFDRWEDPLNLQDESAKFGRIPIGRISRGDYMALSQRLAREYRRDIDILTPFSIP